MNKGGQQVRKRLRRGAYMLPSLLTIGNILLGFYALVSGLRGDFQKAALLIFAAALLDNLDGKLAAEGPAEIDRPCRAVRKDLSERLVERGCRVGLKQGDARTAIKEAGLKVGEATSVEDAAARALFVPRAAVQRIAGEAVVRWGSTTTAPCCSRWPA